jgi:hypothetical protein
MTAIDHHHLRSVQRAIVAAIVPLQHQPDIKTSEVVAIARGKHPDLLADMSDAQLSALVALSFERVEVMAGLVGELQLAYEVAMQADLEGAATGSLWDIVGPVLDQHPEMHATESDKALQEFSALLHQRGIAAHARAAKLRETVANPTLRRVQ